ncbi:MAG: hypothetical protein H0V89_04260 [Deltaproteobacteria bacterium]|nr:hypothetical protein [Deltaproteobacteria bacterium]
MFRRTWLAAALIALSLPAHAGKNKDKDKDAPAPPAAPAPAPAPPVAPEPEPDPEPVAAAPNADMKVDITFGDGTHKVGRVVRIERGVDWYAESGWEDSPGKLVLTLEGGGTEVEKPWTGIKEVNVTYASKENIDCFFESNFDPPMYTCVLKTTPTAKDTEGKAWTVTTRHKWRFTFDDGSTTEFYLNKLPNRAPDDQEVSLNSVNTENQALYQRLQEEVVVDAKKSVTRISIQ